jgi:vacuolar-type H+-ATPase subunit H
MPSHDILDKLFDVEKKAEALTQAAHEEADQRIAKVKEDCEVEFRAAYEARAAQLAAAFLEDRSQSDRVFEGRLAAYRSRLEATRKDEAAFLALCSELVTAKA